MAETRKLAAILVSDVVGFSLTLARLRALRSDLIDPAIAAQRGRTVKRTGDGSLIEFRSVVDAVRCAIEVQNGMAERNAGVAPERRKQALLYLKQLLRQIVLLYFNTFDGGGQGLEPWTPLIERNQISKGGA